MWLEVGVYVEIALIYLLYYKTLTLAQNLYIDPNLQ